jgi:hypothetical protein
MKCFRANDGLLYLVSTRAETPVQGPYKTVEQVKAVASALRTNEWADEIARLEREPQPADAALPVFVR